MSASATDHAGSQASSPFTSEAQSASMSAALANNWWAVALRGVFGIVFGVIALLFPGPTMLSLVLLFSAYMLVDGVFAIISAVRSARKRDRWRLLAFEGIVNIITGVIAFLWPGITVIAFVLLVAAWAIVSGGLMFGAAMRLNLDHGRWWLAFGGVVSVLYGALLIFMPLIGAVVLTWWLGAYALVFGVALLVVAFKLRARRDRQDQAAAVRATT
jgi:uncharacterized membrane protein HdeD (DUF308 family)